MPSIRVLTLLALAVAVGVAGAPTATQAQSPSTQGAFDKLSPGNQKIARALFDGQQAPNSTAGSPNTFSLDDIAAMKQDGKGWGVIFKEMQAQGKISPELKNLGQLVSGKSQPQSGTSGATTITTASGKSHVVGKPNGPSKSGKGHFEDRDHSGRGGLSGGPGRGNGYGQGGSGASASAGGRGGGRGK